jgi:hypothetical protein
MNLEAFYELIKSGNINNAEIAWQIARGMRDSGDKDFEQFCRAVYSFSFGDFPAVKPAEFLTGLINGQLPRNIFRKTVIPDYYASFAPLVKSVCIGNLHTKEFPKGFEVLSEIEHFKFYTMTLKSLGDELKGLQKLKHLEINCSLHMDSLIILPEFETCTSIEKLTLKGRIQLPEKFERLRSK